MQDGSDGSLALGCWPVLKQNYLMPALIDSNVSERSANPLKFSKLGACSCSVIATDHLVTELLKYFEKCCPDEIRSALLLTLLHQTLKVGLYLV